MSVMGWGWQLSGEGSVEKWPVLYPSQVWTYAGPMVPDLLLFSEEKRYMWVLFWRHNLHIIKCANSSEFLHMYTFYICSHHMSHVGRFPSLRELPALQINSYPPTPQIHDLVVSSWTSSEYNFTVCILLASLVQYATHEIIRLAYAFLFLAE